MRKESVGKVFCDGYSLSKTVRNKLINVRNFYIPQVLKACGVSESYGGITKRMIESSLF